MAAAISVDVVRTGFGVKGDEATYVAMTLSAAFDHDLSFQRVDLERFWGLYRAAPEGLFLKRGKILRIRLDASPPFLTIRKLPDPRQDRLYFGKALVYPLVAAPFVRFAGLNGFLILHVLLLLAVGVCGYQFLAARSRPMPALLFTLAFVGASTVPVYAVFLTSDLFNFALVFVAYFLWLYKEVAAENTPRLLAGLGSDVAAAVLLGSAAYSKPTNLPLVLPLIALWWWRRKFARSAVVGLAFAATTAGWFGLNAINSGEFNYQGGDRKTFYGYFPFDAPDATWERRGTSMTTNDSDAESVLEPSELPGRLAHNVEYFLIGRHFGLVPYFFPGVVAALLWLARPGRFAAWQVFTMIALAGSIGLLLMFFPYTWSGGGGPSGNRYFLSLYPALFFITPPLASSVPALAAWIGGALFTAKMVLNPFVAAKYPYLMTDRGPARRLPVELTMANDLPIMLDSSRSHLAYGFNPTLLLYFLDQNAYTPEKTDDIEQRAIWISGSGRADILVRAEQAIDHFVVTAQSPIRTTFTISTGGPAQSVQILPSRKVTILVPTAGVRGFRSYAYLLSARSSDAFTPHLQNPESRDFRNLGVLIRITPVLSAPR